MSATQAALGPWWNYSTGIWTLTLNDREAGILSTVLVVFINLVSSQAWSIVRFLFHQSRATNRPRDGLHHQQQLALRNSSSHLQMLWLSFQFPARWSSQIGWKKSIGRSTVLLLVSVLSLACWSTVQIFLSLTWTTTGNQYLVNSNYCALAFSAVDTLSSSDFFSTIQSQLETTSIDALQCDKNRSETSRCGYLPTTHIDWTAKATSCPFPDQSLCVATNSTPIILDSGYINSNTHLGMNSPPKNAIEYRKAVTCSPMVTSHTSVVQGTADTEFRYHYGNRSSKLQSPTTTFNFRQSQAISGQGYLIKYVGGMNP